MDVIKGIKIKKSYTSGLQVGIVKDVLNGDISLNDVTSKSVKNELSLLLAEKGLDVNNVLNRLKTLITKDYDNPKASDHLRALETLLKVQGVMNVQEENNDQVVERYKFRKAEELITEVELITLKTSEYLDKLKRLDVKYEDVINDSQD